VRVRNKNDVPAWGGLYWQYLEDMDKVDLFEDTPLKLEKRLFKEVTGDRGPELKALDESAVLQPGDKLIVRIELRVDRDMSYVHMKDHRASTNGRAPWGITKAPRMPPPTFSSSGCRGAPTSSNIPCGPCWRATFRTGSRPYSACPRPSSPATRKACACALTDAAFIAPCNPMVD